MGSLVTCIPTQYFSDYQIEKLRSVWLVTLQGRTEAYTVRWGKREGKKPLGRPTMRWENNNKMDLQEVGCGV